MNVRLLTYASPSFEKNAEQLARNALSVGFKSAVVMTPNDISSTDFYRRNKSILEQNRGAGYWLWKPYIIIETLKKTPVNEAIFYCDAGRSDYYRFTQYPEKLIKMVEVSEKGFLLGPPQNHLGQVRHWTKRDCLTLMNMDQEQILNKGLLVTWSLWRHTPPALEFLKSWLRYCEDARCLTDMPNVCGKHNYSEFQDHRHDMAILTLLAYKHEAPYVDFTNTWVHRCLKLRPQSELGQNFYKRPENADRLLNADNPFMLIREYLRLKRAKP